MSTLLLRLAGPLQAWGYNSKFETRRTGREPTKSGVIGLLAAALGRKRDEPLDDLNALRFGVRVDKEGELLHDYQIVQMKNDKTYVTHRYYLSDAVFVVGLESENEVWLEQLQYALLHPVFPLFLGRRSCVPTLPFVLGIRLCGLSEALRKEPWQLPDWRQDREKRKGPARLRMILDASSDDRGAEIRKDLPVSFHPGNRKYAFRLVKEEPFVIPEELSVGDTGHDAMSEL